MSDDLSTEYLRSREADPELEADLAKLNGTSSFNPASIMSGIPARADLGRLGRNALIAAYDGLRNVGELAIDMAIPAKATGIAAANQPKQSGCRSLRHRAIFHEGSGWPARSASGRFDHRGRDPAEGPAIRGPIRRDHEGTGWHGADG
jgi:hypothetical protein